MSPSKALARPGAAAAPPASALLAALAAAALAALTACASAHAPPTPTPPGTDPRIAALAFLTGTWQSRDTGKLVEEQWGAPRGDGIFGYGRTLAGGQTVDFEYLRVVATPTGVSLVAQPGGGAPTAFALGEQGRDFAVFANAAHDFPQRIAYQRDGDLLRAHIEGPRDGATLRIAWVFKRAE